MNPQGSSVINTAQYEAMEARVDSIASCADLQEVSTEIIASLNAETDAIIAQLEKANALAALLTPPTDLDGVVEWVQGVIDNIIGPMATPATTYIAQVTARTAAITNLVNKINKKAEQFSSCSIDIDVTPIP